MTDWTYRELISGAQRGFAADAARCGLKTLSIFYGAAVRLRNLAYDVGLFRPRRPPAPVISIGNLTAGGTGKTPMVATIADSLSSKGLRPVILSRGYKSSRGAANDEKLVLDRLCPGVVHLQSANRVQAALEACARHGAGVLILDDGFQHRRLARDLDVVLVDALDPWGTGHLLPRGLLREPRSSLRRAHVVVLTRADQCSAATKAAILAEIRALRGDDLVLEAVFRPTDFLNFAGEHAGLESLSNPVAAFCGIGNPEGFRQTLATVGIRSNLVGFRAFPDHCSYTSAQFSDLAVWARQCGASALVTTQKDLVKIPHRELDELPLWALSIRAAIVVGNEKLEAMVERLAGLRRARLD